MSEELPITGVEAGEELAYVAAVMRHFHEDAEDDASLRPWAERMVWDRALAVRDGDRIVGNFVVVPTDLSVPGGARVPCAAVTAVGVAQTATRRGLLRRLMTTALDRAVDERSVVAVTDDQQILDTATAVYEQVRDHRGGGVGRDDGAWRLHLVDDPVAWREGATARRRVHVPGRGYATYRIKAAYHPTDEVPDGEVRVEELVAADPEAEQALWQHVTSIDLTRTCTVWPRPVDDALSWMVTDPMRLRMRVSYPMYTRLLDVPAALSARTCDRETGVTLRVVDPDRDQSGTYRWEAGPDGADCRRVDDAPEVTCGIEELSAAWLGGTSVHSLVAARRVEEHVTGAAARLHDLVGTARAPWTPWEF